MSIYVVMGLGLALRVWLAIEFPRLHLGDAAQYLSLACNLLHGRGFSHSFEPPPIHPDVIRSPGYPVFLATLLFAQSGFEKWRDAWATPVVGIQIALDLATVWLIYSLARDFVGRRSALVAATFYSLSPLAAGFASQVLPSTLTTFLLTVWLYITVRWPSRTVLGGIVGGCLGLTCFPLLPTVLGGYVVMMRKRVVPAGVGFAVCVAVLVPWAIRNYSTGGTATPGPLGVAGATLWLNLHNASPSLSPDWFEAYDVWRRQWTSDDPDAETVLRANSVLATESLAAIQASPGGYGAFVARQAAMLWWSSAGALQDSPENALHVPLTTLIRVLHHGAVVLAVIGVVRCRRHRVTWFCLAVMAALTAPYALVGVEARYALPAYPLLYLLAALGVSGLHEPTGNHGTDEKLPPSE